MRSAAASEAGMYHKTGRVDIPLLHGPLSTCAETVRVRTAIVFTNINIFITVAG